MAEYSNPVLLMLNRPAQSSKKYKPFLIYNMARFGVSRALPTVDTQACCLIRPLSELIVRGVLLLLRADHASCTNDVIPRAKHSNEKGKPAVWMASNQYSRQPEQPGHEGRQEERRER